MKKILIFFSFFSFFPANITISQRLKHRTLDRRLETAPDWFQIVEKDVLKKQTLGGIEYRKKKPVPNFSSY